MKKWWTLYLASPGDRRVLVTTALVAVVPALVGLVAYRPREAPGSESGGTFAVDTHIPRGYVMAPIEVDNYESLDSILGQFGWVDLFQGGTEGQPRRLVARNVRLARAPNNPHILSVIVPEREAAVILRASGAFTVVLRRPGAEGTKFVKDPVERAHVVRRKIIYGE